jgi:hypothetical protein
VKLAHGNNRGQRDDYPGLEELARYAAVLGSRMTAEDMADDAAAAVFVKRIFAVPAVKRRLLPPQVL